MKNIYLLAIALAPFSLVNISLLSAQCLVSVDAGPDVYMCSPRTVQTNIMVEGYYYNHEWSPYIKVKQPLGFQNTAIPVTQTVTYSVTAFSYDPSLNLLQNPDFEQGNTAFSSDYIYSPGNLVLPGTYDILTNPQTANPAWGSCGDHTSGSGNMLAVNLAFQTTGANIWCQTVPVTPNTEYYFSFWSTMLNPGATPYVTLFVNGVQVGLRTAGMPCAWRKNYLIWNSANSTSAELCLRVTNAAEACALDDLYFGPSCIVSDSVTYYVGPPQAVAIPATYSLPCDGYEITLSGAGSSVGPQFEYQWETVGGNIVSGANTLHPVVNSPGIYTLTVRIPNAIDGDCPRTASVFVAEAQPPLSAWIATIQTLGCNNNTVTLNGQFNQPANSLTFQWTAGPGGNIVSGANSASAVVNQPGEYQLLVTNATTGCTAETSYSVAPPVLPTASIQPPDVLEGPNDSLTLLALVVPANATVLWSTPDGHIAGGGNTPTPQVTAPGIYMLTVTNPANGCTATASVQVLAGSPCATTVQAGEDVFLCEAGQVLLQGHIAGTHLDQYWWPNTNLSDPVALSSVATVEQTTAFVLTARAYDPALNLILNSDFEGGNTMLQSDLQYSPGNLQVLGNYDVLSNPNAAAPLFSACGDHTSGDGKMLAISPTGTADRRNIWCQTAAVKSDTEYLFSGWALRLQGHGELDFWINTDSVGVFSPPADSCAWGQFSGVWFSGAQTTAAVCVGTRTPDVALALDDLLFTPLCQVRDTVVVQVAEIATTAAANAPDALTCSAETVEINADGSSQGSSFAYQWTTLDGTIESGADTDRPIVNAPGTYSLVVANLENNCTATAEVAVQQDVTAPEIAVLPALPLTCVLTTQILQGQNDTPSGHFSYQWSAAAGGNLVAGGTTLQPEIDAPGTYTLLATNADNGCTSAVEVVVIQHDEVMAALTEQNDATCFGSPDGALGISATGGDGVFTYLWDTGHEAPAYTGLSAGVYTVTVTDGQGCSTTVSGVIDQPDPLLPNVSATPATTIGGTDGSAMSNPLGGTPPFVFAWNTGSTVPIIMGLSAGLFTVTVTDANGCTAEQTATVVDVACDLAVGLTSNDPLCFGVADGSASAIPLGGTAPFVYLWSNGATEQTAAGLSAGIYSVVTTDANGCQFTVITVLNDPALLILDLDAATDASCANTPDGSASVLPNGGTGDISIVWSNGQQGTSATGLLAGTYTATATDANGCIAEMTVTVLATDTEPPVLQGDPPPVLLGPAGSIALTVQNLGVSATDNCGVASILIEPNHFDCSQLGQQTVTITATDISGNTTTMTYEVTVADQQPPQVACPKDEQHCHDDRTVQYLAPVATDNCLALGGSFDLVQGLPSGSQFPVGTTITTYTFTDASGNVGACSFAVTVLTPLTVVLDSILHDIGNQGTGGVLVSVGGSQPGYTYQWQSDGQLVADTEDLIGVGAGTYTLLVTDAAGCTAAAGPFIVDAWVSTGNPAWTGPITVYPNPTAGQVHVVFPDGMIPGDVYFMVFEVSGKMMWEQKMGGQKHIELDWSALPNGLYTLLIRSERGQAVYRMVVHSRL